MRTPTKRQTNRWVLIALLYSLLVLPAWRRDGSIGVEKGFVKARTRVMVRVYEESTNLSKGPLLYADWLEANQYVSFSTERGRIIYDYKYPTGDTWTTDVHADCRGSREEALSIP